MIKQDDDLNNQEKVYLENESNLQICHKKIGDKIFSHSQNITNIRPPKSHLLMISSQKISNNTSLFSKSMQPRSLPSTMQRMVSCLNVEENEAHHRKNIERQVDSFRRFQDREDDVYLRTAFIHHKISGLGQRVKDNGVIEAIVDARNSEWRKLVLDEKMDPLEANEKTGVTAIGRIYTEGKYIDFFSNRASTLSRDINFKSSNRIVNNYQLPNERKIINESRKRRMKGPVLYWGCGNY